MWNIPSEARLSKIPRLYETEHTPLQDKLIYLHFFIGAGAYDFYIAEFDGEDLFWGFAILNNDLINAEWGYNSFNELKEINIQGYEIDCETELTWAVCKAIDVDKIKEASHWTTQDQINEELVEMEQPAVFNSYMEE